MKGVELLSFQALWFVVAGFILGFATSTLWEWLYYRGKRRLQQNPAPPATPSSSRVLDQPTSPEDVLAAQPSTPWGVPYRSPRVYLESEQPSVAQPMSTAVTPPVTNPTPPTSAQSSSLLAQAENKPRLNPATLATLQSTVADTPIAQTSARPPAGTQPFAEQGGANTKVYAAPAVTAPPPLASPPRGEPVSPTAGNATDREGSQTAAPTTAQPSTGVQRNIMVEAADSFDHPDNLSMIKGVGEAYKRRLYSAGIYTWRQMAESEPETLRRITRAKPNANITVWRQQAQELAEKHQRWHTTFQGPLDDLTRIDGIGAITADILYKAGLCTYEQLASAMPDELARIVPAPTVGDEIDFDGWINAAVRLATTKRRNQGLLS